jgi:lexA repressor
MPPFYDICRRRPQMSEQKGKSVKNKELIKEKIIFYIKEHGYAPTVREICEMTNLKSTSSVQSYLCKMFEEGELETDAKIGASRAIRVPGYKYVKVDQKMQEDNQEASKDLQTDVTDQRVRLEDVMGVITTELEKLITTQ